MAVKGGRQLGTVTVAIAPRARGFRREEAGVTGRGVQGDTAQAGRMFGAGRVGGAEGGSIQGGRDVPLQLARLAQFDQATQGALADGVAQTKNSNSATARSTKTRSWGRVSINSSIT